MLKRGDLAPRMPSDALPSSSTTKDSGQDKDGGQEASASIYTMCFLSVQHKDSSGEKSP